MEIDEGESPEKILERADTWSGHATLLILVGIIAEIVLLFVFTDKTDQVERWLLAASNAAIGVGLVIEYACIRKTIKASAEQTEISNQKLREALDRASEAQLELTKFRTPRRKLMTAANRANLAHNLKPFARTEFDVGLGSGGEQADFLWDLEEVLADAGWHELPWGINVPGMMVTQRGPRPISGSVGAQNVEIHVNPSWQQKLSPAAEALATGLRDIGIEANVVSYNTNSSNVQAIHILIGPKG